MRHTVSTDADDRLVTEARANEIYTRIQKLQQGSGTLRVELTAWWSGELRWARNRVSVASDRRDIQIWIGRRNNLGSGSVTTNQIDDTSLAAAVHAAERKMLLGAGVPLSLSDGLRWTPPLLPFPDTNIWSDATYNVTPRQRGALAQTLTEGAESQQLLSAGFVRMRVGEWRSYGTLSPEVTDDIPPELNRREGTGEHRTARETGYIRHTESQCSMTVRHPRGTASGWAGLSSYDWSAIDAGLLAQRALDKCLASLNPVAIEPGRYTVILEPQAVAQLVNQMVGALQDRSVHENPRFVGAFSLEIDPILRLRYTKLGHKVVDERISITQHPMDARLGILPEPGLGPVTWIDHGILKTLGYPRGDSVFEYSLSLLNENLPMLRRFSYAMTGGTTTMDDMISTTKRGIIVSRFSNVAGIPYSGPSLLCTGLTRDGLWLVEDGRISKAIKNMRFTDSPLFVLNQIEQLGAPVPVFMPGDTRFLQPVIVPPLKANDFAFTATIDAI